MSTIEEQQAIHGWSNNGIALNFAEENIKHKYIALYLFFVRRSFGYCKAFTSRISTKEISKVTKLSEPTVITYIKYLVENDFIKINKSTKYIENGGSEAYSYSPCYPKGYGKIYIKEESNKENKNKKKNEVPDRSIYF